MPLLAAPLLAGCAGKRDFLPLGTVNSVNLWIAAHDGSSWGWKITDAEQLSQIVAFVDLQRADWRPELFDSPTPTVGIQLFNGEQEQCTFEVGTGFFQTRREGKLFYKYASRTDVQRFFDVMHLDDATLKEYTK